MRLTSRSSRHLPHSGVRTGLSPKSTLGSTSDHHRRGIGGPTSVRWRLAPALPPARRALPSFVYHETKNIEAVRNLLGQSSVTATSRYLNVGGSDALNLARRYRI